MLLGGEKLFGDFLILIHLTLQSDKSCGAERVYIYICIYVYIRGISWYGFPAYHCQIIPIELSNFA